MIWLCLFIPILTIAVLLLFFHKKVTWWEHLLVLAVAPILILVFSKIGEDSVTKDREYWGSYATEARYYEDWNERVSCRHPIYERQAVGTDSKGNTIYEDVYVGDEHLYDVDYHSEFWQVRDNIGKSYRISESQFNRYTKDWQNKKFVDMHRSYHTNDGDMYKTKFNNDEKVLDPIVTIHTYENRIQASNSILNYVEVKDPSLYGLYDYPKNNGLYTPSILGNCPDKAKANRILDVANAKLGSSKQVRIWFLIYDGGTMETSFQQENYWKGGNKNEFIVCVGLNKQQEVSWCRVFSWTNAEMLKARVKTEAINMKKLDTVKLAEYTIEQVKKDWVRREFKEFEHLKVQVPISNILFCALSILIANVLVAWYVVANEITDKR